MAEPVLSRERPSDRTILVWDIPTRVFHWVLVVLVIVSVVTGNVGGLKTMRIHMLSGYAILALILFRAIWGFIGNAHARFSSFVIGVPSVVRYARDLVTGAARKFVGHNPLGGWSVLVMLVLLIVQAATGLCANDDIFTEGPLARRVGKRASDFLTGIHKTNVNLLYAVIAVHVVAVIGYLYKGDNLIRPMITGVKRIAAEHTPADGATPYATRAVIALAVSVALVAAVVNM